jgi:hypothetical protein
MSAQTERRNRLAVPGFLVVVPLLGSAVVFAKTVELDEADADTQICLRPRGHITDPIEVESDDRLSLGASRRTPLAEADQRHQEPGEFPYGRRGPISGFYFQGGADRRREFDIELFSAL